MQLKREQLTSTRTKLSITAEQAELDRVKEHVLGDFSKNVKVPGFREGKAPPHLIEKQADQAALQSQFVDHAVNDLYADAVRREMLRPVANPQVSITKFVPFNALEFTA